MNDKKEPNTDKQFENLIKELNETINFNSLLATTKKSNLEKSITKKQIKNIKIVVEHFFRIYASKKILLNIDIFKTSNDYVFIQMMKEIEDTEDFQILYDLYVNNLNIKDISSKSNISIAGIYPNVNYKSFQFFAIFMTTTEFENFL